MASVSIPKLAIYLHILGNAIVNAVIKAMIGILINLSSDKALSSLPYIKSGQPYVIKRFMEKKLIDNGKLSLND